MKMKNLTKLALSGVALAAVAATLGTSTYAWYVVNGVATAENIIGTTTANGGSVYVSATGDAGTFTSSINYSGDTTNINQASNLYPVHSTDGVSFTDKEGETLTSTTLAANTISWTTYVQSNAAQDVLLGFSVSNTTAANAIPTQKAYVATGTPVGANETFTSDIVQALRVAVSIGEDNYTVYSLASVAAYTSARAGNIANAKVYDDGASFDANTYYKAVTGLIGEGCDSANGASETDPTATLSADSFDADEVKAYHFIVWLEGADKYCFDSCAGQSFNISLSFAAQR